MTGADRGPESDAGPSGVADLPEQASAVLVDALSHDLRTPLTSILGYSQLLAESLPPEQVAPEHRQALRIIQRNADRLVALADRLLCLETYVDSWEPSVPQRRHAG